MGDEARTGPDHEDPRPLEALGSVEGGQDDGVGILCLLLVVPPATASRRPVDAVDLLFGEVGGQQPVGHAGGLAGGRNGLQLDVGARQHGVRSEGGPGPPSAKDGVDDHGRLRRVVGAGDDPGRPAG